MLGLVTTLNDKAPMELREVREPLPQRNEALVAVAAFSLNRGELRSIGNNGEGWIPGQDIAGIVLKQAEDGSGPAAGARVVALTDELGWAQRVAVPSHRMAVLPDNVSFTQAATLPVAGLTALRTLRHGAPLLGKRVLITGAAGGVGTLAVQLAARSGARVTAVVGRIERAAGLRELGALDVIDGIDRAQGRFALVLESAGGLDEQLVPGLVPDRVVDGLEAVEVDEEHGRAPVGGAAAGEGVLDALGEQGAVGQVGERVVLGVVLQLRLEAHPFGHVPAVEDEAAVVAVDGRLDVEPALRQHQRLARAPRQVQHHKLRLNTAKGGRYSVTWQRQ